VNIKTAIVKRTLQPGQPGTKKLKAKYGFKLVTVRYRYDRVNNMRYKTVELIEDFGRLKNEKEMQS
jgi:hypothetical protein